MLLGSQLGLGAHSVVVLIVELSGRIYAVAS